MDLNSLITDKLKGPLSLAHFTKPWLANDEAQDVFFDNFANCVILYKQGRFTFHDMHDAEFGLGLKPV